MKELISAINKLQDVFNTLNLPNSIQLPQIVMLGSQSTGKSSVLESIVRRPFLPRGSGIVTRCPLVLQLIECSLDDRKYRRENNGTIDVKEWGVFLHDKDRIFTDFDEIRKEIEDQTDLIAGSSKGICAEPINLKIFSPEVVNLTLVDLPGITKVPVGDQPEDIEDQIKSLVMEYIKNPNSIILSVSAANVDLATSESLKYAKEVDPDGKRTLAVLTKIDLMDAGTDANEMLTGAVIPVKLGIVGVINRSQLDINNNKTIAEQLEDEKEYFAKNYKKIASHNGIPHLEQRLSKLLMNHIYECLPNLKKEVQMKRVEWQNIFDQCGEELTNPDRIFMKIITSITNDFRGSIDGTTLKVERNAKKVFGGPAMRKVFDEIFAKEIEKIEPQISKQDIIVYMNHSGGPRPDVFAPEKLFEKLIKENIERLQAPSLDCLQHIHNEIDKVIKMILKNNFELNRFPKLAGRIKYMLIEFLNERLPETESYLKYLIKAELASINKNHPEFSIEEALKSLSMEEENKEDGLIQDGKAFSFASAHTNVNSSFAFDKTKVESKTQTRAKVQQDKIKRHAEVIESLVNNYFPIVKKTVQDLTPKIIMLSMVNDMCDSIDSKLLVLYKDIDELLNESKDNTDKRNEAKDMLKALKIADSTINQVYESEV
ncbi:hypothetical protein PVAND_000230 [Polypedilum vanderplanki]|uniref:Dynamin GTPase n=1 Tax=Polypedilum vanderplanki TaxID=319348 RepID=A0A9J6BJF8_POLVA|nr:hypothetical protein PVAND_000230 [Polypedilum vanderplanki]